MKIQDVRFETFYKIPSRNGVYKPEKFHGSGWRIVNMGELFKYNFISDQEMNRVQLTHSEMRSNNLEDGDLLFGRRSLVEEGAGKCSIVINPIEPLTFESSIIRVRVDKKRVNPLFLFYNFKTNQGRGRIKAIVSGVNVKGIRGSDLKNIKLSLPYNNLDIQNKLVSIISSYDDLINTNRRRIQLLEEAARLLFREWFVYFRFPGHEKAKIVDGVPKGWKKEKINKLINFKRGVEPGSNNYLENNESGSFPFFRVSDLVTRNPGIFIDEQYTKSALLEKSDIVISLDGSIGIVSMGLEGCYSTGIRKLIIKDKKINRTYLYFLMKSHYVQGIINAYAKGTTIQHAGEAIKHLNSILPPQNLMDLFDEIVSPAFDEILILLDQNQRLAHARDLLLPRLMSSEIEV